MVLRNLLLSCVALLAACATSEQLPPKTPAVSQEIPEEVYLNAADSSDVYQIVPERSRAEILVRRGGRLEHLGHNHVISAQKITGYAVLNTTQPQTSRADLAIDLNALVVDSPELRSVYQLDTQPSDEDINGTANNMSTHVLELETWPQAFVRIEGPEALEGTSRCDVTLTLKDVTRTFPATLLIHRDDDVLRVRGSFDLNQSDYGIEPFSVLGGALTIHDRLEITYRLEAVRLR